MGKTTFQSFKIQGNLTNIDLKILGKQTNTIYTLNGIMTDHSSDSPRVFERKAYTVLKEWKERSNGATAMLVEGARRVGKSTLVEEFARKEYHSYVLIDFSKENKDINALFDDLSDITRLLRRLQVLTGVEFKERDTAIIFDEVQRFPRARESIKALVNDGRYDYIETGSLISIRKNVKDIVIPSEEEKMKLHPLDFEEFLWACGNHSYRLLEQDLIDRKPLSGAVHHTMMLRYNEYLAVGGMPQAVKLFTEGRSYQEIDKIKRDILNLYLDDFRKIDPSGSLGMYFMSIPSELSRQSLRFRVKGKTIRREIKRISEMVDSQTVQQSMHVDDPKVGLPMTQEMEKFKMFLEDTGLFVTLCFYDREFSDNVIYTALVRGRLPANLGYVYENAVAQSLVAAGYKLFYHTFPKKDSKHRYEVDFLIPSGKKICPVEVKSSSTSSHASLDAFISKHKKEIHHSIMISPRNLKEENEILYIPIYMTGLIGRV
ncbi:ATPase AAA+ superfamily [methanogenic archaeon mixed culture ISO4-G1]|nr:ATPase AAA+ superfamily [methanogenic archaeon mixed culture ISO4-G1]